MLDYGALPPEVNSTRMYSGPGSGPMMAAAAAWDALASGLESVSRGYTSVISQLQGEGWSGSASVAMADAAAPYVVWLTSSGANAEQAASRARAAAAAYETAFAAVVPPALVAANRTQLASLVATNTFGQNTTQIAATEAAYAEMWAQDAQVMYGYAASSSTATTLTQFTEPPQTTSAAAQSTQAAAVSQAAGSSAAGQAQSMLSQLISALPQQLQALATTASSSTAASTPWGWLTEFESLIPAPVMTAFSNFNTLSGPTNYAAALARTYTAAGSYGYAAKRDVEAHAAKPVSQVVGTEEKIPAAGLADGRRPVVVNVGRAPAIGGLTVPQAWASATPVASAVVDHRWLSEVELAAAASPEQSSTANMFGGVPAAAVGAAGAGLLSHPTVNNVLRVAPRKFKMPRPHVGG